MEERDLRQERRGQEHLRLWMPLPQDLIETAFPARGRQGIRSGFMRGMAIERMTRDARIQTIGGGATEVMLEEVGKRI